MTITEVVEILQDGAEPIYIEVEFEGKPRKEDAGIGSYEYCGFKEYDSRPYWSCEYHGIGWDKTRHTEQENKAIETWLENYDNWCKIDEMLCKEYQETFF